MFTFYSLQNLYSSDFFHVKRTLFMFILLKNLLQKMENLLLSCVAKVPILSLDTE